MAEDLTPLEAIHRYARSSWDVQRLAYIRGIAVAAAVEGWRASRILLPLMRELVSLPDTAVRQALASQLTPMGKLVLARILLTLTLASLEAQKCRFKINKLL